MTQHPFIGLFAACGISLLAHGIAYASLALAPPPPKELPPSRVAFRVLAPEPPRPLPPPPPAPEPIHTEPPPKLPKAKPIPSSPPPAPEPAPAPVDLRGVTLTNDTGGGSFSSVVGNGSALEGPVGPLGAKAPPAPKASAPVPVAAAPAPGIPEVAAADLSTRPVPPELTAKLRDHYPAAAKARGIGGSATVRVRIEPDGRVRRVELMTESFEGFGEACRRTLVGSEWSAPRGRDGRAVATHIRYTCRFVVGP
jgi:TonB family protein